MAMDSATLSTAFNDLVEALKDPGNPMDLLAKTQAKGKEELMSIIKKGVVWQLYGSIISGILLTIFSGIWHYSLGLGSGIWMVPFLGFSTV